MIKKLKLKKVEINENKTIDKIILYTIKYMSNKQKKIKVKHFKSEENYHFFLFQHVILKF